ncbi:MAG: tetraacyldisaccharide 4'-kinase, partial [Pirellulales bacterium]|nr:tetraacyldisaccharide 4'-kinase [Pirellulales bacterium]
REAVALDIEVISFHQVRERLQQIKDHDPYAPNTVERLQQWIRSLETRISCVVCTHKDLVKLRTDRLGGRRLVAMVIELTFLDEDHAINTLLESKILPGIKVDGAGDASAQ